MSEQRGRPELVRLDNALAYAADDIMRTRKNLMDAEEMAYAAHVGERGRRAPGFGHVYLYWDVGSKEAKQALSELDGACITFRSAMNKLNNLFLGGPSAPHLMGSDLGNEDGSGAEAELSRLRAAQQRRRERGEYVPNRIEDQPHVPGSRRRG